MRLNVLLILSFLVMGAKPRPVNDVRVRGDDGTESGQPITRTVNGSRIELDVNATVGNLPTIPDTRINHQCVDLADGATVNMGVDGSTVNKTYDYVLAGGEILYLTSVSFYIYDAGGLVYDKFGNNGPLTNGLKLEIEVNGTTKETVNLKRNPDLATFFFHGSPTGSMNSSQGKNEFKNNMELRGDDGDFVRWTVRDDLTSSDWIQSKICFWKAM